MADYVKNGNTTLGEVAGCKNYFTSRKILTDALDGTPYIQTTGDASQQKEVYIYCETKSKRDAMDRASNTGATLTLTWKGETISGYVDGDVEWGEWRDGRGVGHFALRVLEVVSE